jgi:hypothetical protein
MCVGGGDFLGWPQEGTAPVVSKVSKTPRPPEAGTTSEEGGTLDGFYGRLFLSLGSMKL